MKARVLGRCVTFNGSYAFLRPIDGGKDLFAHESELPDGTIHVGDKCTFDTAPDKYKPGRMRATHVIIIDGDEKQTERAEPGMYGVHPDTENAALAEGLAKLIAPQA